MPGWIVTEAGAAAAVIGHSYYYTLQLLTE